MAKSNGGGSGRGGRRRETERWGVRVGMCGLGHICRCWKRGVQVDMDVGKNMNIKLMAQMCKGSAVDY